MEFFRSLGVVLVCTCVEGVATAGVTYQVRFKRRLRHGHSLGTLIFLPTRFHRSLVII